MNAEPTPPQSYPRNGGSPVYDLPLNSEGPDPFFPPVCLKSHWDPTQILRRTLPAGYVAQPLDPRPWTRICMQYTTAGSGDQPAPPTDPNMVLPSGGQFYPPDRYANAIDAESQLRRLDRPLGTCEADQWEPTIRSDMYDARQLVPRDSVPRDPSRIQELAYPKALLRAGPYACREADDRAAVALSSEFNFNQATKQDRYKLMNKPARPAAPEKPLLAAPEQLRPDLVLNASRPEYAAGSYEQRAANERMNLVANAMDAEQRQKDLDSRKPESERIQTPEIKTAMAPDIGNYRPNR
jgi:hypothetical protein